MVRIHRLYQKIMHRKHVSDSQSAAVTLKIRSRSPKSNQLVPCSQQCFYTSLVKIHLLVQKITQRKEATRMPTGSPFCWGDIFSCSKCWLNWTYGRSTQCELVNGRAHGLIKLKKICPMWFLQWCPFITYNIITKIY